MPGIRKVSNDILARAVNKLDDVLIHVGEADNDVSGEQLLAILKQSSLTTNLRKVGIYSGGLTIPDPLLQLVIDATIKCLCRRCHSDKSFLIST